MKGGGLVYKNLIIIIAVFIISLGIMACTPIHKEDVSTKLRPDSQEENPELHMDSQIVKYADLNNDNIDEKIILTLKSSETYKYSLEIGDIKIDVRGNDIEPDFNIVDIDYKDGIKEIAISEYGPSNDEATRFYYYTGEKIINIGYISGFYGPMHQHSDGSVGDIKIEGLGKVITKTRGDILHTWFYDDEYIFSKHHYLLNKKKSLYEMGTKVKVLQPMPLQKSQDDESEDFLLMPNDEVIIAYTDNKQWCMIITEDGQEGWFAVDGFDTIRALNVSAAEVFSGLSYAD